MPQRLLKAYLWFIAAFHIGVGLAVNVSRRLTEAIAAGYGADVDWTPQFRYIIKPLGAFMIILGVLAAVAARDPRRYAAVVLGFASLFALRALQRAIFATEITSAFAISPGRNTLNLVVFVIQAAVLYLLWRTTRERAAA